jgi:hypothetical protein
MAKGITAIGMTWAELWKDLKARLPPQEKRNKSYTGTQPRR